MEAQLTRYFAAFIAIVVSAVPAYGLAQLPSPLPSVSVQGPTITMKDIGEFMQGAYATGDLQLTFVEKPSSQMPPDTPYADYRGRSGKPPKEIVWVLSPAEYTDSATPVPSPVPDQLAWMHDTATDALVAAIVLAVMDSGRAGRALQSLYAETPSDRDARLALGRSVVHAFAALSDQQASDAVAQTTWIATNVKPGASRAEAYAFLKSKGFVAYNTAYVHVKGGTVERSTNAVTVRCDNTSDRSSANWPYRNEPLPKVEAGPCADLQREMSGALTAEPTAYVMIPRALSACIPPVAAIPK